jgi:hypothetical protein
MKSDSARAWAADCCDLTVRIRRDNVVYDEAIELLLRHADGSEAAGIPRDEARAWVEAWARLHLPCPAPPEMR